MSASPLSNDERKAAMAARIAHFAREGWRVETLMDFQAILVRGHPTNHVLHLLLSVVTFGLWLVYWLAVALDGGEQRVVLHVDESGHICLA
jgi:hypothetical protein